MVLSDICVRRPVFATVLSLMLILVGLMSYTRLTVREYPKIEEPVVSVRTNYTGASPEIIESQVTKPLEDSLAGIEGVDVITSISRQESSRITIRFRLDRDPDSAAADVRDRVSRVRRKLPDDVDDPVISKVEADASPIIYLAFSSDRHSALEVTDVATRIVKPRLQTLPGAADVGVYGDRVYAMRIWLDRHRLAGYGLTVQDVEAALRAQNVEVPAGLIESRSREFTVVARTDLTSKAQFENVVVRPPTSADGYPVRIRDVADVQVAAASERSEARFKGKPAVALGLIKQATANPLDLAKALRAELPRIEKDLPEGMTVQIANDYTVFIDRSIDAVFKTIGEAIILVAIIIFFFLRNWRAVLVPLVTIPVSLIGAFTIMLVLGFSINTLTLLALVLAVGLVVDDAIVMLENVHRHLEMGKSRLQAARDGAKEIGFAVVAMTLTLAAVYAPMAFMTGRTGKLFIEFALTLAGAVIVSGFVALTLSPMMCSKLLRHETRHGRLYNLIEGFLNGMIEGYHRVLQAALRARWVVILMFLAVAGSALWLLTQLKSELAPTEDRGFIIGVYNGPEGATIDYMDRYARQIEALYAKNPNIERYFVITGRTNPNSGISFAGLPDWRTRSVSSIEVARELRPGFFAIPGVRAFPVTPPSLGQRASSQPISFVILSSASYREMAGVADRMVSEIEKIPGFTAVDVDLKLTKPEVSVQVDRDKATDAGVPVETIGRTLETMLGGRQVTRFKRDAEQYDVIVQMSPADRSNPSDITGIYVRSADGQMLPLDSLVKVDETVAPRELNHFGQRRAVTISASLGPELAMGDAVARLEAIAARVLPPGYAVDYDGQTREFKLSSGNLQLVFAMAIVFIYLVLSAQFESFRAPFVIMLTVPLSMAGALAALWLTGGTLNVYSQIGLVTLVGLITRHGILIVEFANQLRDRGETLKEAIVEASVLRLRPILMTTAATILGAIPLALAAGAGAESRQQIGWVIVGGLLLGTFFTLFVVPAVYTLVAPRDGVPEGEASTQAGHAAHPAGGRS
ncbi:efflux RND transporter permease subunit [Nitrogeniibacter mangrovi]|uniref:Efflux RND transporter permease subunit n=1 Tax=Nitrogeniibacter mangrovi TaxID=2016596 RepID=A0A6C1B4P0_9RHOO|nr:efflux RND transporter permease subunit [Nitrogeniibacter mangrovi]QID18447.1 efflux RND transporter permease subunit [Nitrogeniibacter mangrovi]